MIPADRGWTFGFWFEGLLDWLLRARIRGFAAADGVSSTFEVDRFHDLPDLGPDRLG